MAFPTVPGAAGQPAVVACQISQNGPNAGFPTQIGGPSPILVSFLWYVVPPNQTAIPQNSMACGNNTAPGAGGTTWMTLLPAPPAGGIQFNPTEILGL